MKKRKLRVGDKVMIKSLEWYDKNKNHEGIVRLKEKHYYGISIVVL